MKLNPAISRLSVDQILWQLGAIAFSNVGDFFDDRGNLRPISSWSPEMGAATQSLEVVRWYEPDGDVWVEVETVVRLKLWNKVKALHLLLKHFGLLKPRLDHSGDVQLSWVQSDESSLPKGKECSE